MRFTDVAYRSFLPILTMVVASCSDGGHSAPSGAGRGVPEQALEIDDQLLNAFIADVCGGDDERFVDRWFAHEATYWERYQALIYENSDLADLRDKSLELRGPDRRSICRRAVEFRGHYSQLANGAAVRIEALTGTFPEARNYLIAPILLTDARTLDDAGAHVVIFNATHPNFDDLDWLETVIAHEYLHAAQLQIHPEAKSALGDFDALLYAEGLAMFGGSLLFPETPLTILAPSIDEKQGEALIPAALMLLRERIGTSEDDYDALTSGFFYGGLSGDRPDRFGYYLGLKFYQCLAQEIGEDQAIKISPQDFKERWRTSVESGRLCSR